MPGIHSTTTIYLGKPDYAIEHCYHSARQADWQIGRRTAAPMQRWRWRACQPGKEGTHFFDELIVRTIRQIKMQLIIGC